MACFLDAHPGLRPYVLSDVQLTTGDGAYGTVEVTVPLRGAAERVQDVLLDSSKMSTQFAEELQLLSTLHHPNVIQFLGLYIFPGSRLPAPVMERLLTSLHDLLYSETDHTQPPSTESRPLSFFKIGLKCSVLHNIASGLAYLHERTPPVAHCDLSAKNVLLTSHLVAKLAHLRLAATVTKAIEASIYMPPEAIAHNDEPEKSKCDASIDVFSFGVVTIFMLGETFPCDLLAPTYMDLETGLLVARTELQRRSRYMQKVNTQLCAYGQLCEDHPLIRLIQQCLYNVPARRPNIHEVLSLLLEARSGIKDDESERNKVELIRTLQKQPSSQNLAQLIKLQQQLKSSTQQLTRKEAELTTAEETIRKDQWQIQEMRLQEAEKDKLIRAKDRELAQALQKLRQQEQLVQAKETELAQAQRQLRQLVHHMGFVPGTSCMHTLTIVKLNAKRPLWLGGSMTAILRTTLAKNID